MENILPKKVKRTAASQKPSGRRPPESELLRRWASGLGTMSDVAWICGITVPGIKQLVAKGVIKQVEGTRVKFDDAVRAIVSHYRERSKQKHVVHEKSADQKNRLTAAQADMAEMTRGVMAGELLPSDWVEKHYADLGMLFVQRLMSMPDIVTPRLQRFLKDGNAFEEVRSIIRDVATQAAEEVASLEINYDERPLRFRPSGRPEGLDLDVGEGEAPAEDDAL